MKSLINNNNFLLSNLQLQISSRNSMFGFPFGFPTGNEEDDEYNQGQMDGLEPQQEFDNSQYYKVLGLEQNATEEQIKQSYEKLKKEQEAKQNGGDPQKLKEYLQAFEVINDPIKRDLYDKFGKMGLQQGGPQGGGLLDMFFGQGKKNNNQKQQLPKVQPTKKPLQVTLQNIYNGDKIKVTHNRMRICQKCSGKGGQNVKQCEQCNGQGMFMQMYQMGPGMYQQVQKKCDKCEGQGQIIGEGGKCDVCQGKKILQKQKEIQIDLDKGTPSNFPIKLQCQGNQIPGAIAGDLYYITQQKQHEMFKRIGADLHMKKSITLLEALTGFQFKIKHLDGTEYTIYTEEGEVIADEMKKIVSGLGMPFYKDEELFGNLIIEFHIVMPKRQQLTKEQIAQLCVLLPGDENKRPEGEYEMFEDFEKENLNTNQQGGQKPEDQYDPDEQQGGVQCGTQ